MRRVISRLAVLGVCTVWCAACTGATTCPPAAGVAVQVLGSGGPIADDARAATSYLIWIDGRSRVLIDVGSCLCFRLGQAGARPRRAVGSPL